jgi:3-methyl-2-oxobutanoate hydroxymethyltransferase
MTMEQMLYHAAVVSRGVRRALVVADLPFMSYQVSPEDALRNAGRFLKESLVEAVKLEGGEAVCPTVKRIVEAGIPVMGHLGLTPQSVNQLGGYRLQGRSETDAAKLLADACRLEELGAFAFVLECVPAALAEEITRSRSIPTIGIGAGAGTSGQVLVVNDLLGLDATFRPKFSRRYRDGHGEILAALNDYARDVRGARFPARAEVLA